MLYRKLNRSNLRRFVRGRAYTTIAQVRRYFHVDGDDVSRIAGPRCAAFVALPALYANALSQLWREGKIDIHLSLLVRAPVIEGVFPLEAPLRSA